MSSRALRKLMGEDELSHLKKFEDENLTDDGEIPEENRSKNHKKAKKKVKAVNPFDILGEEGSIISTDSETEIAYSEEVPSQIQDPQPQSVNTPDSVPKSKKKKKKKKKNQEKVDKKQDIDIDATVEEVNKILGELPTGNNENVFDNGHHITMAMKALLTVEHKNLNPDNEMRRIFGSRVIQAEQNRRRGNRRTVQRNTWLARPKDTWPPMGKAGLSMQLLENKQGLQYFTFEHSKAYQEIQFQFLDAVESMNPQNIMDVLRVHPHHIDSLLQLSEVCKMSEDMQMATELVERALYVFESSFHSLFSLTQGNCRLDYRRPENRAFYLALFHHLVFVGKRGCNRTALEICKLLLSLDPDGDPLCVLLMIDFYAIRAEQYNFLIRMYHEWGSHRNLTQLPNFAFSVPLAMFHHCQKESMGTISADAILQNSLLMFPSFLFPLLSICNIQADPVVEKHSFFKNATNEPRALQQLIALYIGRSHVCWKDPDVMHWLEHNVKEVLSRVDSCDTLVKDNQTRRKSLYQGTPRNIYRHIMLSEIKEATAELPPEIAHSPILSYDPLPPSDTITSYKRPERMRRAQENSNSLSLFFRSLLPNYNPQEIVDEVNEAGAVGGEGQNLRDGVGVLMNAMRDLLNNIQPVPPPVENQNNENGEERDDIDEWD